MGAEEMLKVILDKIDLMENDMRTMKSDIGSMKSDIGSMKSDIDSMKSDISTMNSRIDYLSEKINLVNQKVDDLKIDVNFSNKSIRKDIAKLQDAQDTIIAVLEGRGILKVN